MYWPLLLHQIFIGIPGHQVETLQKLADEALSKQPKKEKYDIQFPEGSTLSIPAYPNHPAHGHSIKGVNFKVNHVRH